LRAGKGETAEAARHNMADEEMARRIDRSRDKISTSPSRKTSSRTEDLPGALQPSVGARCRRGLTRAELTVLDGVGEPVSIGRAAESKRPVSALPGAGRV